MFLYFNAKQFVKAHTPIGRVLTSSGPWAQQPRAGEAPVAPIARANAVGQSTAAGAMSVILQDSRP